jgi:1-acyl-sn-glycerol-3-phosphate acyltransferase
MATSEIPMGPDAPVPAAEPMAAAPAGADAPEPGAPHAATSATSAPSAPPTLPLPIGSARDARLLDPSAGDGPESGLPIEWPGGDEGGLAEAARELLSSDYYLRQWGRIGMRNRSEEVDEFGLDPKYEARYRPLLDLLYSRYFRVEVSGIDQVPSEGRCVVVANHSGAMPYDGIVLRTAMRRDHPARRELRWLTEDFITYLPFVGAFMNRLGAVRACQENAERLLRKGTLIAVFPEGVKGIGKLFRDRYRLQRFGRGGFIRLCLRTGTPIVPCAIVGAEEASPMLFRMEGVGRTLGLPYIPITPTFPALGPLGLLPAPTKWQISFADPLDLSSYGPEGADDQVLVSKLAERVRTTIQAMLDGSLASRKSVFFG